MLKKWKKPLDKVMYAVAFIGPAMTFPQVIKIFNGKDATGVSLISWSVYVIISLVWLAYGFANKKGPIIFSSILWTIAQVAVVVGILIYG